MPEIIDCPFTVTGSGPDIIMIHGIGANRSVWDGVVAGLANHFRCITYDLRGHGKAPQPSGIFTLADLVADLKALQDKLDIASAHVIGHSLGGMIGPAYAYAFPERVLSLGLLSTAAFRTAEDQAKVQGVVKGMRQRGVSADIDILNSRWFTDDFAKANPAIVMQRKQQVLATNESIFLNVFDIYAATEMSPWLHEIKHPALVLTGELDGGCNPRLNQHIHAALSASQLVILPQLKHSILLEAPLQVTSALLNFYSHLPTSRPSTV